MDPQSRMYTLVGAAICAAGAALLCLVDSDAAREASQSLEEQAVSLLTSIEGDESRPPAVEATPQPPAPQPPPAPPAPARPGQRVSRR